MIGIDNAKSVAERAATKADKPYLVWRMPLWRVGIYGVLEQREMPPGAEVTVVKPKALTLFDL